MWAAGPYRSVLGCSARTPFGGYWADLRELPGAPLVLVRQHIGTEADVYALTSQNKVISDPARAERVRIEPVHEAWIVLGHHLRRMYELVAQHGLTIKADIYAAASLARATGDAMVVDLEIAGLLTRSGWGTVERGPESLDHIADRHRLHETRDDRISRHRAERAAWRTWLVERERLRGSNPWADDPPGDTTEGTSVVWRGTDDQQQYAAWLESLMATGPPDDPYDTEREAIDMIAELLGGRIVAA